MKNSMIVRKAAALKSARQPVEATWDIIRKYVMPMRSDFLGDTNEASLDWRQNRDVFDGTASQGLETLSASLHGSLTSPASQWFELAFRDRELLKDAEAKKWIQNAAKQCYNALIDSNFNLEVNETYIDLVGYGTSIIVQEEDPDEEGAVIFKSIPLQEIVFEEDRHGTVLNLYRSVKRTPLQIIDQFETVPSIATEKAKLPDQQNKKMSVIFCIFKRKSKSGNMNASGILAPLERPYGYKWILEDTQELLEEGGYYEMPAYAPRWRKAQGSQWGFSPSHLALPDILTANQIKELLLVAGEKTIDPPLVMTERGVLSDIDTGAGGLNVVGDMDAFKELSSNLKVDVSELNLSQIQASIRQTYYVDQLQLKESGTMTATETQVRYELMQRLLGSTAGRIENDLLSPTIQRTFNILFRAGKLGDVPVSVAESEGKLDVVYTSPLARAQRVDQASNIERWLQSVANTAQIHPEITDIPSWDNVFTQQADLLGVPADLINNADKITKIRNDRAKAQQEQAQAEQANLQANTGKQQAEAGAIENG